MRNRFGFRLFVLAALVAALPAWSGPISLVEADAGTKLPSLSFSDLGGHAWTQRDLAKKTTIVVVWATWCGVCKGELPDVARWYARLEKDPHLAVVTLNVDEDTHAAAAYAGAKGYRFPVLLASSLLVERPSTLPRTWIVDRSGVIRKVYVGYGAGLDRVILREAAEVAGVPDPLQRKSVLD